MKLRMKSNSIRLRLSQSEVERMAAVGSVSETISFGPEPYQKLVYTLMAQDINRAEVEYFPGSLEVALPEEDVAKWATSEQVGFDEAFDIGEGGTLTLLVEKDFRCLTAHPGEDQTDAYPHPEESHGHVS